MPITQKGIEYDIPREWLEKIDLSFLKELRKEFYRIQKLSLDQFYHDALLHYESTAGWGVAFKLACIKTNKLDLYNYSKQLEWYDYDIFCSLISELMVQNKLLIDNSFEDLVINFISQELNIPQDEIKICFKCGEYFLKEDMVKDYMTSDSEDEGYFVCVHCNGFDKHQYYLKGLNKEVR